MSEEWAQPIGLPTRPPLNYHGNSMYVCEHKRVMGANDCREDEMAHYNEILGLTKCLTMDAYYNSRYNSHVFYFLITENKRHKRDYKRTRHAFKGFALSGIFPQ